MVSYNMAHSAISTPQQQLFGINLLKPGIHLGVIVFRPGVNFGVMCSSQELVLELFFSCLTHK